MNAATLMVRVQALLGRPLPISTHSAPLDKGDSTVLLGDKSGQIAPRRSGLRSHRNLAYSDGVRMDLLVPTGVERPPVVLYVPGGGFIVSPKAANGALKRHLAEAGYAVASIEYRTVRNGATYVDGVSDVKSAVRYLRANAERFSIDPGRIALWGESAGGYLVAMAGLTDGDPRFESGENLEQSSAVQAVVDKFGGSNLSLIAAGFDEATVKANEGTQTSLAKYVFGPEGRLALEDDPEAVTAADPASFATAGAPPFLLFHGTDDRIISPVQTAHLHSALLASGASSTRYLIDGAGHGDLAVKGGEEKYWSTRAVLAVMVGFLDRHLKQ
ncbi:MAG: hypothetical protein JWR04_1838 [Rhodoglobus sp.]|nr:hypothetical protein [Rhodoglobus sp.]